MTIYCYHKCSTCKNTLKFLNEQGYEYDVVEITENKLSATQLRALYEQSGQQIKQLFNTSGNKYKELNLKDKLSEMTLDQQLALLASDGMLIKRPLLIDGETVIFGFNSKKWKLYDRRENGTV